MKSFILAVRRLRLLPSRKELVRAALNEDNMKQLTLLITTTLLALSSYGEYAELTAIKKHAILKVKEYAKKLSEVDPNFEGVIGVGKSLNKFTPESDISEFTNQSKNYWRAVMEMSTSDPSILFATAYMYLSQGKLAYGERYLFLGSLTMGASFRSELNEYTALQRKLSKRISSEMEVGINFHDNQAFEKAREVYDHVLVDFPASAWTWYEKGYTYLAQDRLERANKSEGDATDSSASKNKPKTKEQIAAAMYRKCREHDPFYWKAYQGDDPVVIDQLLKVMKAAMFLEGESSGIEGLRDFAIGCHETGLFDYAAHAEWILVRCDSENIKYHLIAFLDNLDKLKLKDIEFFRSQFKLED